MSDAPALLLHFALLLALPPRTTAWLAGVAATVKSGFVLTALLQVALTVSVNDEPATGTKSAV